MSTHLPYSSHFVGQSSKIVLFKNKKLKYMNRFLLKLLVDLIFFCYNLSFKYKTIMGEYDFKTNFKTIFDEYDFRINFQNCS